MTSAFSDGVSPLSSDQLAQLSPSAQAAYHLLAGDQPDQAEANVAALSPEMHTLLTALSPSSVVQDITAPDLSAARPQRYLRPIYRVARLQRRAGPAGQATPVRRVQHLPACRGEVWAGAGAAHRRRTPAVSRGLFVARTVDLTCLAPCGRDLALCCNSRSSGYFSASSSACWRRGRDWAFRRVV